MARYTEQDLVDHIITLYVQAYMTSLYHRFVTMGMFTPDVARMYCRELGEVYRQSGLSPFWFGPLVEKVIGEHVEGELGKTHSRRQSLMPSSPPQTWQRFLSLLRHEIDEWEPPWTDSGHGDPNDESDYQPF